MNMDCLGASLAVSSRTCSSSSAVNSNNVVVGGGGGGGSNITTTTVAGLPPFHYLISEQAKSILALQELQNEVGALLEFRDLVMETFPHLRQKISVPSSSSALSATLLPSNSAPSSTNATTRWEPGIRVKRKLGQQQRDPEPLVPSLGHRCRSNSHGKSTKSSSGEAASSSSTSTNASSAVQDSGFCAESSKDHSANSSNNSGRKINKEDIDEDDLCSLLDMIHQQGTRLRLEVEYLRSRLNGNVIYSPLDKEWRRCRSFDDLLFISRSENDRTISSASRGGDGGTAGGSSSNIGASSSAIACISSGIASSSYQQHPIRRRLRLLEAAVEDLRKERTILLNRIAEMESEHEANLAHANQLMSEMEMINTQKQRLQEELQMAVTGRSELNQRIHQLYCKLTARNNQNRPANNVGHQCSTSSSSSLLSPSSSSALMKQPLPPPPTQATLKCSSQNLLLYNNNNNNDNNSNSNSNSTRHSVVNSSSAVATDIIADSSQALHPSCCSKDSYFTPICYSSGNKDRGGAHRSSPDDYFRVVDNDDPPVLSKESANSNVLMMSSIELDGERNNCVIGENDEGNKLIITTAMSPICLQHSNNTRPSNPLSKKLNDGVESGQVVTATDHPASPPINLLSKPNIIRFQRRSISSGKQLGALDGIVTNPSTLMKIPKGAALATNTLTAILTQFNPIELQRHLITCAYQNETLVFQMERVSKSRLKVIKQLHKFKEQNYDLKFQLEEKTIQLEGTRARVRMLERLQCSKLSCSENDVPLAALNSTSCPLSVTPVKSSSDSSGRRILCYTETDVNVDTDGTNIVTSVTGSLEDVTVRPSNSSHNCQDVTSPVTIGAATFSATATTESSTADSSNPVTITVNTIAATTTATTTVVTTTVSSSADTTTSTSDSAAKYTVTGSHANGSNGFGSTPQTISYLDRNATSSSSTMRKKTGSKIPLKSYSAPKPPAVKTSAVLASTANNNRNMSAVSVVRNLKNGKFDSAGLLPTSSANSSSSSSWIKSRSGSSGGIDSSLSSRNWDCSKNSDLSIMRSTPKNSLKQNGSGCNSKEWSLNANRTPPLPQTPAVDYSPSSGGNGSAVNKKPVSAPPAAAARRRYSSAVGTSAAGVDISSSSIGTNNDYCCSSNGNRTADNSSGCSSTLRRNRHNNGSGTGTTSSTTIIRPPSVLKEKALTKKGSISVLDGGAVAGNGIGEQKRIKNKRTYSFKYCGSPRRRSIEISNGITLPAVSEMQEFEADLCTSFHNSTPGLSEVSQNQRHLLYGKIPAMTNDDTANAVNSTYFDSIETIATPNSAEQLTYETNSSSACITSPLSAEFDSLDLSKPS